MAVCQEECHFTDDTNRTASNGQAHVPARKVSELVLKKQTEKMAPVDEFEEDK